MLAPSDQSQRLHFTQVAHELLPPGLLRPPETLCSLYNLSGIVTPHPKELRVLFAIQDFAPIYSGAAVRYSRYSAHFRDLGVTTEVFAATPAKGRDPERRLGSAWEELPLGTLLPTTTVDGTPVTRVRLPEIQGGHRLRWYYRGLRAFLYAQHPPADIIQAFHASSRAFPGMRQIRRHGKPVILTGTSAPVIPDDRLALLQRRLDTLGICHNVDHLVVSSTEIRSRWESLGFFKDITVIPNGVDTTVFFSAGGGASQLPFRRLFNLPDSAFVILFIGKLQPSKGLHYLLAAWPSLAKRIPNAHLVVVDPGMKSPKSYSSDYGRRIIHMMTEGMVHGPIHRFGFTQEVADIIRSADIFVQPSETEGMSNVFAEAMASGLPVVTTPFTGLSKAFGVASTHYELAPFDPEGLGETIVALAHNRERRRAMGQSARRWVEANLSMRMAVKSLQELYHELKDESSDRGGSR